jgi:hypothetical protein
MQLFGSWVKVKSGGAEYVDCAMTIGARHRETAPTRSLLERIMLKLYNSQKYEVKFELSW